jgi:hypothetical protein
MAATHFMINGQAVPCPPDVESEGPAAMQAWYDKQVAAPAAPQKAVKPAADPKQEG